MNRENNREFFSGIHEKPHGLRVFAKSMHKNRELTGNRSRKPELAIYQRLAGQEIKLRGRQNLSQLKAKLLILKDHYSVAAWAVVTKIMPQMNR